MNDRPDIPKRLVGRIKAAQEKVLDKRRAIVASKHTLRRSLERVAEFESDPQAFADRYYRGHTVDSYPVQTTISRELETIARHQIRKPQRYEELAELEDALVAVEDAVRREVAAMRTSSGRVPWPAPLSSFERLERERDREELRQDRMNKLESDRRFQARLDDERREAKRKIEAEAEIDIIIAGMPDGHREYLTSLRAAMKEGRFTFMEFLGGLQAKTDAAQN